MNLAIRGIDSSQVKWNNEGSFLKNAHKDLKADFIIANPPFNDSDWGGNLIQNDARWQFGVPPDSNANFSWIQHFIFHLSHKGKAGFILADSSLSSSNNSEKTIRDKLVSNNLIDCIVSLPALLFSNTQIAVCIWFVNRNKENDKTLFIDASKLGVFVNRKNKELTQNDIKIISQCYHSFINDPTNNTLNVRGFSQVVSKAIIKKNNSNLSPNRYVIPSEDLNNYSTQLDDKLLAQKLIDFNSEISIRSDQVSASIQGNSNISLEDVFSLSRNSEKLQVFSNSAFDYLI